MRSLLFATFSLFASLPIAAGERSLEQAVSLRTEQNVVSSLHLHWIHNFSYDYSTVILEDGSQWSIAYQDIATLFGWRIGDSLLISKNDPWYKTPTHAFFLQNQATGGKVQANILLGPFEFGENSHWVIGIDRAHGILSLVSGRGLYSTWYVSDVEKMVWDDWAVNDTVILGINDSWFTAYPTLLINVNQASTVRAQQI